MKHVLSLLAIAGLVAMLCACGGSDDGEKKDDATAPAGGSTEAGGGGDGGGHEHAETSLGSVEIEGMKIELAQGHGAVTAGKEGHLVVKLPYSDKGATAVRAWIGQEDRTKSFIGKGTYAPSHDDYDVHAEAPNPLPENAMWWIEIEKPDGTKAVGSARPIL